MKYRKLSFIFGFLIACNSMGAQKKYDIAAAVILDSVVVKAQKKGFDVQDFVDMVQTDQTFYYAFKNLRTAAYKWHCDMSFSNKKGKTLATYESENTQHWDGACRWMTIENEKAGKKYFKKRNQEEKYYTAKLYDRLFCTDGKVCGEANERPNSGPQKFESDENGMEGHIDQLKKLIFSPGQFADVPFIKKKTAIFSDEMRPYYDFSIKSLDTLGAPCYQFIAQVKKEYENKPGKTVIKKLVTTFSKTDFQVINRTYTLAHNTALYTFDVDMNIDLKLIDGKYFPSRIVYDGYWNVPFKKYENGRFEVRFKDY